MAKAKVRYSVSAVSLHQLLSFVSLPFPFHPTSYHGAIFSIFHSPC